MSIEAEAKGLLQLAKFASQCAIRPIGYVDQSGTPVLTAMFEFERESLWILDANSGKRLSLDNQQGLTPYSPVLAVFLDDESNMDALKSFEATVGRSASDKRYVNLLPTLFSSLQ